MTIYTLVSSAPGGKRLTVNERQMSALRRRSYHTSPIPERELTPLSPVSEYSSYKRNSTPDSVPHFEDTLNMTAFVMEDDEAPDLEKAAEHFKGPFEPGSPESYLSTHLRHQSVISLTDSDHDNASSGPTNPLIPIKREQTVLSDLMSSSSHNAEEYPSSDSSASYEASVTDTAFSGSSYSETDSVIGYELGALEWEAAVYNRGYNAKRSILSTQLVNGNNEGEPTTQPESDFESDVPAESSHHKSSSLTTDHDSIESTPRLEAQTTITTRKPKARLLLMLKQKKAEKRRSKNTSVSKPQEISSTLKHIIEAVQQADNNAEKRHREQMIALKSLKLQIIRQTLHLRTDITQMQDTLVEMAEE